MSLITFLTEDNKVMTVDERITKFSELFNIINTRLLNQNNKCLKTIISTNLNLAILNKTYGERITSRLIGNYNICRFFGEDIRFMNK